MKKNILSICIFLFFTNVFAQNFSQNNFAVSDLNAIQIENNSIKLTWTIPEKNLENNNQKNAIKYFLIFRDTKQITSYEQLDVLKPIAEISAEKNSFIDNVEDSKEYFYSVICKSENGIYKIILPSINTTVIGIKSKKINSEKNLQTKKSSNENENSNKINETSVLIEKQRTKRNLPLPSLNLLDETKSKNKKSSNPLDKNFDNKNQNLLGEKALAAGEKLGKNYLNAKNKIAKTHIFEEDFISPEGGDGYFLFRILKDYFIKKDYNSSIKKLTDFLSVHRDKEIADRATFYLGQSYYFTNNFEQAVFNFLQVKDVYPELSKRWIDSSLDLLEISK